MTAAGGSLEDCHTNTFVFADLSGLKWKCLKHRNDYGSAATGADALENDPVLRAFGECLVKGLLCTWRRRPRASADASFDNPAPRVDSSKELWVFWYAAEEPSFVTELQDGSSLIVDRECESSEIGYETRVLFFKALHHVIERIHLRNGYVRFGKYFVRPLDMPAGVDAERTLPEYVNALNYEFSLLGESLVVVTVCVQRQPTILRLAGCHLEAGVRQPVILGPWTIRAVLSPDQPTNPSKKADDGDVTPTLAEIQAAVTHEWKKWRKLQALPVDEDDEEDEADEADDGAVNAAMPKMVLVEIDGVQMFYPSCFVGILASEMDFPSFNRQRMAAAHGQRPCASSAVSDFCAEDNEVEEIFASRSSVVTAGVGKPSLRRARIQPTALNHCRRSFDGVRTARRSFEDGCLSVMLGRRTDAASTDGGTAGLLGNAPGMDGVDSSTRWNFFDYLRREYCYCKMCTNSTLTVMETDAIGSIQLPADSGNNAFHRSPTGLVEVVTPDHSPTFVDELKALRLATTFQQDKNSCGASTASSSSSATDGRAAWASNVVGGRLEMERIGGPVYEPDVLALLQNNRHFLLDDISNLPPPRAISPFTPIGAISPESSNGDMELDAYSLTSSKKTDPTLQQRLKDFNYTFNPLKIDNFTQRSYHLIEKTARKARLVGPPQSNAYLTKCTVAAPGTKSGLSNTKMASDGTGKAAPGGRKNSDSSMPVLKSLLDDGGRSVRSCTPPSVAHPIDRTQLINAQLIRRDDHERPPVREPRRRRQRSRRRQPEESCPNSEVTGGLTLADWANVEDADAMTSSIIEEGHADVLNADDELRLMDHRENVIRALTDVSVRRVDGDVGIGDESALLDQMVETPPALLSHPENYANGATPSLEAATDGAVSVATTDEPMDVSESHHEVSSSGHYPFTSISGGNHIGSSSDQILSPPASNEQVEFSGISSVNTIGQSLYGSLSSGTIMHDSLSIIYPTPPTPMQQFSPQNVVINAGQLALAQPVESSASHHHPYHYHPPLKHTLTEPALLPKCDDVGERIESLKENVIGYEDAEKIVPNYLMRWAKRKRKDKFATRLRQRAGGGEPRQMPGYRSSGQSARNSALTTKCVTLRDMDRTLAAHLEAAEQKLNQAGAGHAMYGGMPPNAYGVGPPALINGARPMMLSGGRHPNYPNFISQQPMSNDTFQSDVSAMMARGGGVMPPNFRGDMMMMQQQQYILNNQMQAGGVLPPGMMKNGPNPAMFGCNAQQQQQMMAARQQQMNGSFPPFSSPQQSLTMNQFGSPQMTGGQPQLNSSNSVLGMEENGGYGSSQFSSPKTQQPQFAAAQHTIQRAASNSSAQHMVDTPLMDHHQHLSSVSSVSDSSSRMTIAQLSPAVVERPLTAAKLEAIARKFQRGNAVVLAVLLRDTVLDLHFDSVFDGCPICCCNANIRTPELGLYIQASEDVARCDEIFAKRHQNSNFMPNFWSGFRIDGESSKCNCGFSAVRHRYLCGGFAGLFSDDSVEACGVRPPVRRLSPADSPMSLGMGRMLWFNHPNLKSEREFLDLLRQMSLNRDVCATLCSSYSIGSDGLGAKIPKLSLDATHPSDYVVSRVDSIEMDRITDAVVEAAIGEESQDAVVQRPFRLHKQPIHHSWGVQVANEVREPKDSEYIAIIREVQPLLEEAMRRSRSGVASQTVKKLEGPLTWRSFILKTSKVQTQQQEDEMCQVEPIPNVIVATHDREPSTVTTSPQLVSVWEKLSLSPYDQTKDVLYLAVVPDANVIVEKCRIFMEELSSIYSDCRFGYHGRVNVKEAPRDGIIQLSCCPSTVSPPSSNITEDAHLLAVFEEQFLGDRKAAMSRLKGYADNFEAAMLRFFTAHESVFSRRAFYESLRRNKDQQTTTSLANSEADSMPPPALPIHSPNSVLSCVSGPMSANAATLSQNAPSISPNAQLQRQPQQLFIQQLNIMLRLQISPASCPTNSAATGSSVEELTAEAAQQQTQQRKDNDSAFEKEIEESLSAENPNQLMHMIVIYLINPFSFGSDAHHPMFARMAMSALLRAYNAFVCQLNVNVRPQVQLEIVNLQSLYDYAAFCADPLHEDRQNVGLGMFERLADPQDISHNQLLRSETANRERMSARDSLRRIAFTVFSQPRSLLPEHMRGVMTKSMTRFGIASSFSEILDELKTRQFPRFFKVQSCPFILSPTKSIGVFTDKDGTIVNPTSAAAANSKLQLVNNEERVLFVTYCLIGDEWLCGAVTDEQGHLLDNVLINLIAQVPSNGANNNSTTWLYANQSQIFDAIQRLWLYIQSILLAETRNWRLVIGRIGKLGHGELKAWTETLSKKNLRAYNSSLKKSEMGRLNGCNACSQISGYQEMPAIFSACLISTEPELHLRVFPSSLQSEANPGFNLFTASTAGKPGGSGTSGTSLAKNTKSKSIPQGPAMGAVTAYDPSVTHIMVFPTILNVSFEPQAQSSEDDLDFENLLLDNKMDDEEGIHEFMNMDFVDTKNAEETTIDNQPMATGYYISTAPALDMPEWFWSACPSARRRSPVHLKNSLHIHTGNIQQSDEIAALAGKGGAMDAHHPLDSNVTDEVLKYVLEKYNALSWMNVDFATGARLSCLPVHVQALLRLYKGVTTLLS